jgi:hypothetical protein
MRYATGFALATALLSSLASPAARAQQIEVEVGESLVCDTQQQVERFVTLFDGNAENAASAVNNEENDPNACGVVAVAFVRGPEIATTRNRTGTYRVMRILVLGVVTKSGIRTTTPTAFYSIDQIDERQA